MTPQIIVWQSKITRGWNGEQDAETLRTLERHHATELKIGLERIYTSDAHFVPYVVVDPDGAVEARPFRINKRALSILREDGADLRFDSVVIDVDAPKGIRSRSGPRRVHSIARWYEGQIRELKLADAKLAARAWSYSTRGGCRFLWVLEEPLEAEAYEELNRSLRVYIEKTTKGGITPDPLSDWTRCYRLPNVEREGFTCASELVIGRGSLDAGSIPSAGLAPKKRRIAGLGRANTPLDAIKRVREPGRNSYLTRVAGALRRAGLEYEELEPALQLKNEHTCDPPLDEDEVERIAASVCGYPVGDEGELDPDLDPERARGLDSGSESELAEILLTQNLEPLNAEPLVFDHGGLWRFEDDSGIWEVVKKSEITGLVTPFDGTIYGEGKHSKKLRVSSGYATGVYKLICELREGDGFFDAEAAGVAFRNGLVRLAEDGELEICDHDPDARKRFVLPFDFSERATCPRWLRFLDEVFADDDDRDDKVALLGEFIGACLLGQATRYQRALLLVGDGANGKSTFLNTIANLFPPAARASVPPQDLADPYNRATLAGIAINIVTEMPEAELVASEALKAMIDGSEIRARHPYGRPFDFRASAGMLFAANELPGVRDTSHGFWRRWLAVAFNRTFDKSEQDTQLEGKLAEELPGIAVWALEGATRLLASDGFTVPASSDEKRDEWRHDADSVAAFVEDELELGPEYKTEAAALYRVYQRFCEARGLRPVGYPKFGKRMIRAGAQRFREAGGRRYCCKVRARSVKAPERKEKVSVVSERRAKNRTTTTRKR